MQLRLGLLVVIAEITGQLSVKLGVIREVKLAVAVVIRQLLLGDLRSGGADG